MTFWLDAHLDPALAAWLGSRFRIVAKHVREIDLRDADDIDVFHAARRIGQIVVMSKDGDFEELVSRLGSPPQVIWLTCGNLSTLELQAILARKFTDAVKRLEAGEGIIEISGSD